jgi:SAM-dependent methyltransferase
MNDNFLGQKAPIRMLVALTSYGTANDNYLSRLIEEYRSMPFDVDIVVLSNLSKVPAPDIEVRVGFPGKNPWSLPFPHKKVFAERLEHYDFFVYSEDDMLMTETNLRALMKVNEVLRDDEIAGFLRSEKGQNGAVNYPDIHENFHWDPASIRSRGEYTLAKFTNEHAACYVLTQSQLRKAIRSGGFLVEPHEGKYDLLCSAATDPYTQCGFTKLIPISKLDDFTLHHLSNKYAGKVGVSEAELRMQVNAMLRLAASARTPASLLDTETKLWRGLYSKDYYEPLSEQIISMIPPEARSVLSIGCGSGATESWLVERGLRVAAVPLDPIICATAAAQGVKMVLGDFNTARAKLDGQQFDCVLFLNVLHLAHDPVEVLSLFRDLLSPLGIVVIQTPNMLSPRAIWGGIRDARNIRDLGSYKSTGAHLTFVGKIRNWCHRSGFKVERNAALDRLTGNRSLESKVGFFRGKPESVKLLMAQDFVTVATKA